MQIEQTEPADVSMTNSNLLAEIDGAPRPPGFLELPIEMLVHVCPTS